MLTNMLIASLYDFSCFTLMYPGREQNSEPVLRALTTRQLTENLKNTRLCINHTLYLPCQCITSLIFAILAQKQIISSPLFDRQCLIKTVQPFKDQLEEV